MKARKLRLVSALLALAMLLAMVPVGAFAEDSSADGSNLIPVPVDQLDINNGVCNGIKLEWYNQNKPASDSGRYFSVTIPDTVTKIADNAFYSHKNLETGNNDYFSAVIGKVDFSQATNLTSIGYAAFSEQNNLSGEIDLSNTKVDLISSSAFSSTAITGVVLPTTLTKLGDATLDENSRGSVFSSCESLNYVRTEKSSTADFELPAGLKYIGPYTFRYSFTHSVNVKIPASVETIGSEAFNSNYIGQIIVERESSFENYNEKAFYSEKLTIFKSKAARDEFYAKAGSYKNNNLTYPIKLTYAGTDTTQDKLNWQSIQYEKDASGFWTLNSNYTLPDASSNPSVPVGFTAKWMLNGKTLKNDSTISATNDTGNIAEATYSLTLVNPEFNFAKNGEVQNTSNISVELTKSKEQSVGVKLSHPLLKSEYGTADEYVYFLYSWNDVKGWMDGPRTTAEPALFTKGSINDNALKTWTECSEIPITKLEDERATFQDWYQVTIRLVYCKNGNVTNYNCGTKSFYVTVTQPDEYTISYDLNGGTAADGVSYDDEYVVVNSSFTTKAAPTKDGYTFTGWSDGTNTYKAGETITPAGDMILTAQWKEAPTPVVPEPAKTYPVSSDFGKLTDQKDGGNAVSSASKGQRIYISLPEDKQTQGDMKFTYWDVQPESLKDALIASGFDPYSTETSFEMPELADGQTLTINPHYEPMDTDSGDDSFLMTAAAVAGGTALTGFVAWQGYNIFAEVYMKQALPAGAVLPQNRQELALLLWNKAGNPAPVDSTLYTDVDPDDANAQAAASWAVENELLKPADKNDSNVFKPEKSVSVGQVYRAWKKAKKLS